jgi:hypothetical protein
LAEPKDPSHLCVPKLKNKGPQNQINKDRAISYIVGQKSIRKKPLINAHMAYILETGKNEKGEVTMNNELDIGLIIVRPIVTTSTVAILKTPKIPYLLV